MLVDLPTWFQGPNCPSTARLAKFRAENPDMAAFEFCTPRRLARGVYEAHSSFDHELSMADIKTGSYPFSEWMRTKDIDERMDLIMQSHEQDLPEDYGVCDSYEQILSRWPQIDEDPRNLVIFLGRISKEEDAGWRWHKNGPYIGVQKPMMEHIGDEPKIKVVYMFSIVEIKALPEVAAA